MTKPPLDKEWLRQGASGPVPMGEPTVAGRTCREVPRVSKKRMKQMLEAANRRWKAGEPIFRIMTTIRVTACTETYEGRVATDLSWISDFYDPESVLHGPFQLINMFQHLTDSATLNAALTYMMMKSVEMSDTPSWYAVGDGLARSLLGTQLKGVYPGDVKLPMPAFFVELPPGLLTLLNNQTGDHEVRALGVAEGCPQHNPRVSPTDGPYGRRLLVMAFCEPNENSIAPEDDNILYFSLPLYDDTKPLEELLATDRELSGPDWRDEMIGGTLAGAGRTNLELRNLIRGFVVNLLLYLATPNADVLHANEGQLKRLRKKKRTKGVRRQIKKVQERPDWVVGSRVVIKPGVRKALERAGTSKGRQAAYNVLVRGYWRRQWRGKKTEEKPKGQSWYWRWIEPTVRNRDASGGVLGHEYEVKK